MELSQARHAFVTGGASGLGLGIVDAMARRGLNVTIADINADALAQVAKERGDKVRGVVLDTRDRAGWQRAKEEAEAVFGPVDVLVNNAGIAPNGREFADMDPESFDRILAINLVGIANGVFTFAAAMRERGRGHIVNTSSQAGLTASVPGVGAYAVAKFGVTALSEGLRQEMAPHGVGVSVLCPGYVSTNLAENTLKVGGEIRQYAGRMPESDITPRDVGEMVAAAIENDEAVVVTHKHVWQSMEPRLAAIRAACDLRDSMA
ncbi:SDR family oxidoreductase [Novosphingobium mangrovi (ex Huang et al. 2023)]|uniref:SDR family oxidoreductase n=1 Tax=Novosphingobium mangrovi (ex Huang et al. 2023) TaxID=2976432 RepID=A0ABT2I067_9SPHN|nr:SDR family oxidoreductase [Novosphingobium mangrovi (ex Huang et al. 2023)]MCT2398190.1 SDR family oxidoreductase [Novosphingobium mangrovi (ex Huang et al. 2023)]